VVTEIAKSVTYVIKNNKTRKTIADYA
jgi:hypothetical protein